jgi:hypothetical protein
MIRSLVAIAFALLAFAAPFSRALSAPEGATVVVNSANPVTSLSRAELKRVVTGGTKQWEGGAVVHVGVIPSDSAPETQYLASLLDVTPRELLSRLQEQVFKGELRRPAVLRSSGDCLAFVRSEPGAICVVAEGPLPAEAHVVTIR